VYLLWPVGNAQIGRNSLQTLQKRTPLQSGTVVSLEEFTTSGSSGLTQPDSSTSESESLSLAVKWVYFEDDELHAVGVEEASDMLSLLDFFYCLRKVVVKKDKLLRTHRSFAKKDKPQRASEALGKRCVKADRAMMAGAGRHVTQWVQWVYASSSPNSVMHANDRVYADNPLFFRANRASFLVSLPTTTALSSESTDAGSMGRIDSFLAPAIISFWVSPGSHMTEATRRWTCQLDPDVS
jgi:hypothetical protein